ncbi:MAG: hypothetical protein ACM3XM_06995 [Mycobacterium leprae]
MSNISAAVLLFVALLFVALLLVAPGARLCAARAVCETWAQSA